MCFISTFIIHWVQFKSVILLNNTKRNEPKTIKSWEAIWLNCQFSVSIRIANGTMHMRSSQLFVEKFIFKTCEYFNNDRVKNPVCGCLKFVNNSIHLEYTIKLLIAVILFFWTVIFSSDLLKSMQLEKRKKARKKRVFIEFLCSRSVLSNLLICSGAASVLFVVDLCTKCCLCLFVNYSFICLS